MISVNIKNLQRVANADQLRGLTINFLAFGLLTAESYFLKSNIWSSTVVLFDQMRSEASQEKHLTKTLNNLFKVFSSQNTTTE